MNEYDKQHIINAHLYDQRLKRAFGRATQQYAKFAEDPRAKFQKSFEFKNNQFIQHEAEIILKELNDEVYNIISSGITDEWNLSNRKNDALVSRYIKNAQALKNAPWLNNRNIDALEAFTKRQVNGLGLSERVWNSSKLFMDEMEVHLGLGILNGDSADTISRRVRSNLTEPDKLFRRVKNEETGKFILSKRASEFNPGQGVYRSSYKNAHRLARTETNMAYRLSDQMRWEQIDFIVGYEVKLSAAHPVVDICDSGAGKYPKAFVFTGWHPNCLCYAVPIMLTDEEFDNYIDSILDENEFDPKTSKNYVNEVPPTFKKWIKDNNKAISNWQSKPYFMRDNPKMIEQILKHDLAVDFESVLKKDEEFMESFAVFKEKISKSDLTDFKSLSETEQYCIFNYTTSYYIQFNSYLRNKSVGNAALDAYDYYLRNALSKCPKFKSNDTLFRGVPMEKEAIEKLKILAQNKGIKKNDSFMSSSTSESVALYFTEPRNSFDKKCMFYIKKHSSGVDIKNLSNLKKENEVLFNSGTKFRYLDYWLDKKNGLHKFVIEEVD